MRMSLIADLARGITVVSGAPCHVGRAVSGREHVHLTCMPVCQHAVRTAFDPDPAIKLLLYAPLVLFMCMFSRQHYGCCCNWIIWCAVKSALHGMRMSAEVGTSSALLRSLHANLPQSSPQVPSNPQFPALPSNPGHPGNSQLPSNPQLPALPCNPSNPKLHIDPQLPSNPQLPALPSNPSNPQLPSIPQLPSNPQLPALPSNPNNPQFPNDPQLPALPRNPGSPSSPQPPQHSTSWESYRFLKILIRTAALLQYANRSHVPTCALWSLHCIMVMTCFQRKRPQLPQQICQQGSSYALNGTKLLLVNFMWGRCKFHPV